MEEFADSAIREIYYAPHVIAGDNSVDRIGDYVALLNQSGRSVLLVVDRALGELGVVDRVTASLSEVGFTSEVFSDITAEPEIEVVRSLAQAARNKRYCGVVGVGGGSAMDPAKLAAFLATNSDDPLVYVRGRLFGNRRLPLILVPTTAGTGAEVSRNSIVTMDNKKVVISSPGMIPDVAILDATLSLTAPPSTTAASGLDALCHAVETYLSSSASTFTATYSLSAVRIISQWLPIAYMDGSDVEARRALLYAANLAGLSINAVVVLGHTMAYTIATRTHLPHGVTTGMCLPYCLTYNARGAKNRIDDLASAAHTDNLPLWARGLCDAMGVPASLADIGLSRRDIPEMVRECIEAYPRPNNPVPFDERQLTRLYEGFYVGDFDVDMRQS